MKKLVTAMILAAFVASPALAHSPIRHHHSWRSHVDHGRSGYAQVPMRPRYAPIYRGGSYGGGTDPDPHIRLEILRTQGHHAG